MNIVFEIFSNREVALLFWVIIILGVILVKKQMREPLFDVIKFISKSPTLLIVSMMVLVYILLMIDILQRFKFWELSILKDTIFWTLGVGFVLVFNSVKVHDTYHFKKILLDVIKWTIIFEFIVNFYTFSLPIEIILLPVLVFIGMIQAYSELYPEYKKVESVFKSINSIFGLSILAYAIYKLFNQPELLFTVINIKSFLLPLFLTTLFLPFIYFLTLYSHYESLFIRLNFLTTDEKFRKDIKLRILLVANFRLEKLLNISTNIAKMLLVDESKSLDDIKKISKIHKPNKLELQ